MSSEKAPRRVLVAALALLALATGAILWLPRWWENHLYRQAETIAGVGAQIVPGSLTPARSKLSLGMSSDKIIAAIGKPSLSVGTQGTSSHDVWTYYFHDGTMIVNLTDGVVARVSVDYHPPRIPTSARP